MVHNIFVDCILYIYIYIYIYIKRLQVLHNIRVIIPLIGETMGIFVPFLFLFQNEMTCHCFLIVTSPEVCSPAAHFLLFNHSTIRSLSSRKLLSGLDVVHLQP